MLHCCKETGIIISSLFSKYRAMQWCLWPPRPNGNSQDLAFLRRDAASLIFASAKRLPLWSSRVLHSSFLYPFNIHLFVLPRNLRKIAASPGFAISYFSFSYSFVYSPHLLRVSLVFASGRSRLRISNRFCLSLTKQALEEENNLILTIFSFSYHYPPIYF